jgi:hypothetical protein
MLVGARWAGQVDDPNVKSVFAAVKITNPAIVEPSLQCREKQHFPLAPMFAPSMSK